MENESMVPRIGTFFLIIGAFLWILFIASDMNQAADFAYFFWGTALMALGWFMRRKYYKPPPPSNRFGWLRSWMQKQREAKAKKEAEKKAKAEKKK
jgi:hypothetical protein